MKIAQTSIIIVTYNSEKTIKDCLNLVSKLGSEIIVVDNNSNDNTVSVVQTFPNVKVIQNKTNLGFGAANNIGVRQSTGEYVLLLNPDTTCDQGNVDKLESYIGGNKDVAVVGPKLLNSNGTVQKEMARFPNVISQILILLRLHRFPFFNKLVYSDYDYEKIQEVQHLMGAALFIRRKVFEEVGGFDEKFFLWFEETDLLKRITDKGYKIIYNPDSVVTHLVGQSTRQLTFWKRQTIWNSSLLYYFQKHKTWFHILILLPFILLSYPAAFISSLIKK